MPEPFVTKVKVRFRDLDAMGHMNNAVYFTFMEIARTDYYLKFFDIKSFDEFGFILAKASCDFKAPASIDDVIKVSMWVSRIGNSSWTFRYEFRKEGSDELVATAETVQVAFDYKRKETQPIRSEVLEKLKTIFIEEGKGCSKQP